ncbi:hypothetical protein DICVIV_03629 [Dictyocaulus viviparus]|uniref:G-protein coupled receptors family 1 profile domain-containing protein n=1 Tax=Dictyocaulus viviparus TaxID=29172 RepID=A0A0D8Y0I7_DICVI|nr:hypothetical protein DICVIV_03629 [Dictyocaulus viviparus]
MHVMISIALHAITLYLVVLMAFIRFSAMRLSSSEWLHSKRAIVGFSVMMLENGCLLMKGNLWLTGIFLKAIPCVLLFIFTIALIARMKENKVKRSLYTSQFHAYVYLSLADVLDLLSLINCYVAFLVYICTCSRYRQTLLDILPNMLDKRTSKWPEGSEQSRPSFHRFHQL